MLRGGARLGLQIHDRNQNIRPTVVSLLAERDYVTFG